MMSLVGSRKNPSRWLCEENAQSLLAVLPVSPTGGAAPATSVLCSKQTRSHPQALAPDSSCLVSFGAVTRSLMMQECHLSLWSWLPVSRRRWMSAVLSRAPGPWPVSQPRGQFAAELPVAALEVSSLSPWQGRLSLVLSRPPVGFYFPSCFGVRWGHMTCCGPSQPLRTCSPTRKQCLFHPIEVWGLAVTQRD